MVDAAIQKQWINTLFRGTKIVKLMSYVRLEFNNDFIHEGVSMSMSKFLYGQWHFFKCEITTIIVGNFETILNVSVTKEREF